MIRRLGESSYRAESPSEHSIISTQKSDASISLADYVDNDKVSCNTFVAEDWGNHVAEKSNEISFERVVEKMEVAETEASLCTKLTLIVDLVSDFAKDAVNLYESASELLKEMKSKIRTYIYYLDEEMDVTEKLLRFNFDNSTICDQRIDWLLFYTKVHKEMRRILNELSDEVCEELQDCLESRNRGIIGNKPSQKTLTTLEQMREGMLTANRLLVSPSRRRA